MLLIISMLLLISMLGRLLLLLGHEREDARLALEGALMLASAPSRTPTAAALAAAPRRAARTRLRRRGWAARARGAPAPGGRAQHRS